MVDLSWMTFFFLPRHLDDSGFTTFDRVHDVLNVRVHDLISDLLSGSGSGSFEDQLYKTILNPILGETVNGTGMPEICSTVRCWIRSWLEILDTTKSCPTTSGTKTSTTCSPILSDTLLRDSLDCLDNSYITCGMGISTICSAVRFCTRFQWKQRLHGHVDHLYDDMLCVDNVLVVRGCRGVLVFECGAVDRNDNLRQVCFANQKCNKLVLHLLRPCPYCVGLEKLDDFACGNHSCSLGAKTGYCNAMTQGRCQPPEVLRVRLARQDGEA